jgi:hypothetical protein|tara:strand:- start:434 stop:577 length:144 start_codon:yes stop_codon:yes gene_type:complete
MNEPHQEIRNRDQILGDYLMELAYTVGRLEIRIDTLEKLEKHNQKLP